MRTILNCMIMFVMLYVGKEMFPDNIQIDSMDTMIMAIFWILVIGAIYSIMFILSAILIPVGVGCLTIIPLMAVGLVFVPFELYMLDKYLEGFTINGFWTYIIFGLLYGVLSIKSSNNN